MTLLIVLRHPHGDGEKEGEGGLELTDISWNSDRGNLKALMPPKMISFHLHTNDGSCPVMLKVIDHWQRFTLQDVLVAITSRTPISVMDN